MEYDYIIVFAASTALHPAAGAIPRVIAAAVNPGSNE
jgi:hypothetical protein